MALINVSAGLGGAGVIGVPSSGGYITSGLLVWYKFDDTSGADSSGSNNTGILQGSPLPTLVAGKVGGALNFNNGGYVGFTSLIGLGLSSATSAITICCWIKTSDTADANMIFCLRNNANGNSILNLGLGWTGTAGIIGCPSVLLRGDDASGQNSIATTTPVNNGNWHHVALTRTTDKLLTIYVDGVAQGSTTDTVTSAITAVSNGTFIGYELLNGWYARSSIDDFRYYNRALSSTELGTIASLGETPVASNNVMLAMRMAPRLTLSGVSSVTQRLLQNQPIKTSLIGVGGAQGSLAKMGLTYALQPAVLGGAGKQTTLMPLPSQPPKLLPISPVFDGGFIDPDTRTPYGTWNPRGHLRGKVLQLLSLEATFNGEGTLEPVHPIWMQADFIWPGIVEDAGSQLLYRQAWGLEKAMADVGAYRLTQTYAELIIDQWDPWRISATNLPYLAWALGVNLWEETWSTEFKRKWTADQWLMKYERGSAKGLIDFINTVNASPHMHARVTNLVVPPASFYPGPKLTEQERKDYVARFPQLRLYPYAPRPQLPYLGYLGGFSLNRSGQRLFVRNGHFFGPLRKFYPTNYNAGGLYLRKCTLYDPQTGEEKQLTVRTITAVPQAGQKEVTYDEVNLDPNPGNLFYPGAGLKRYLLPNGTPSTVNRRHAVVLGRLPRSESRMVRIPRDGTLDRTQYQAIFTTIVPGLQPINVRPELVPVVHPRRLFEFYCDTPMRYAYLTKSNAWQYFYERWYLFDPTRLPDYRKAYTFMGRARFGIHRYTAEADILASFDWPKFRATYGGYIGKGRFFAPKDTRLIDQIRRAVTASMALRDTVQIDTNIKRRIQIKDLTVLDGRFSIGQYVTDTTA